MSDTENTQNQLSNIEAGQIELLTERIISNKPSDAEIIYNKRKHLGLTQKEFADKIKAEREDIKKRMKSIASDYMFFYEEDMFPAINLYLRVVMNLCNKK